MKKVNFLFMLIVSTFSATIFAQGQAKSDEKYDYSSQGHFSLMDYDVQNDSPLSTFKVPKYGTRFIIVNEKIHPKNDYNIYLLDILDYVANDKKGNSITYQLDGSNQYINIQDNDKIFWMKSEDFDNLEEEGYIVKRYHVTPTFAYGGSLSVPFKIRPATSDFNMKITPEITLGGYLSLKQRLSRFKPIYLFIPVATLGVTTIGINENNVIQETNDTENVEDGLVLGRTFSVGTIFEFSSFQFGFVLGWDKAAGEIGKNWAYNNKYWYSFSIGYSFFGRDTGK